VLNIEGEAPLNKLLNNIERLEMRSEQLRIHLQKLPTSSSEFHTARTAVAMMQHKIAFLRSVYVEFQHAPSGRYLH
jgi:hypothetical protein